MLMKAITFRQYGSPAVLQLTEVDRPTPKANEVLVKIHAASGNALDWHTLRGEPFLARLEYGLRRPRHPYLGADLAGTVEAVGDQVTRFQPGDAVFGEAFHSGAGSFAEYVCVPETALALKPDNLSFEEAAAVPLAGLTALQGLRDKGKIRAGQRVLVNGASGAVGTFAVQIAKALGAHVTAVCSKRNHDLVRTIGADEVIDYQRENFTRSGGRYDLILDVVGNHSVAALKRALKPQGIASIVGFTSLSRMFEHLIIGPLASRKGGKTVGMMGTVKASNDDLQYLKVLLETQQIAPIIDRCYPLSQTADAIRYLETGRARGKVVIVITA
jgi:NADPH:quinone reductase-like Zn-dependent oxidoreductase